VNVGQLLANAARRAPSAPAISAAGRTIDYRQFNDNVNALARGLAGLGLRPGDRVATFMPNSGELLEAMFACFTAGLAWVPLNAKFTATEVDYHLEDSGAAALITSSALRDVVDAARGDGVHVVATGSELPNRATAYPELLAANASGDPVNATVDRDTLAWLFYTSGTTGRPKGAMLSHGVLSFVVASWLADLTPMTEHDVTLHAAPLTHCAGFHALATTARGAHHVIAPAGRFDPAATIALLAERRVTNTWLVPTQIIMLADAAAEQPIDLPDLAYVVYGGAPFPEPELRRALAVFGPRLVQLYGQGETPMTATVLSREEHGAAWLDPAPSRLASAGYARPGMELRIVDADDRALPADEVGEVCVRGAAVMSGYWQRDEATAEALRGGWLHTGDLGRLDDQGCLFLLDRVKDVIITGGSNVYAVEVEAALRTHPLVRDTAVVGVPDRTWGEQVVAIVVTDGEPGEVAAALQSHCAATLATYKHPRRYQFVAELPRNAYGKVVKRELRDLVAVTPQ
jgi:acyl-CoA synthetase (AMP-forming)/AMP-acid ligase II